MALFVEDLLMSVLKVLWFSTMDNDNIGNNNISELVHETQPFILSPMIPWRLSARIVTLGWAAASWSKASLLLQNKLRVGGSQRRNVLMLRRVKSAQSLHVDDNNSNNTAITTNTNSDNDNDHDDDDDRKVFACYHLLVAYGVLRFLHSSKQVSRLS